MPDAPVASADRVIVIEETSEIHLNKPNVLRLEARRAQAALGQEAPLPPVTIADLLRASLRHRPDRILVGEVRGAEAFDLLQALNTGHLGSMSTIHANSSEQALTRLGHCVLTANVGLPHRSTREAIALAIQVVAHIARVHAGRQFLRGCQDSRNRLGIVLKVSQVLFTEFTVVGRHSLAIVGIRARLRLVDEIAHSQSVILRKIGRASCRERVSSPV